MKHTVSESPIIGTDGQKGRYHPLLTPSQGVGPKSIEKLIAKFKSVARIKMATEADIASVVGPNLARKIKEALS